MKNRRRHLFSRSQLFANAIIPVLAASVHFKNPTDDANPPAGGGATDPVTKLRLEFAKNQTDAQTLIALAVTENRELTDAEKAENERRFTRCRQIKSLIDDDVRFAQLALENDPRAHRSSGQSTQHTREPGGREDFDRSDSDRQQFSRNAGETDEQFQFRQHTAIVNEFIRTGEAPAHLEFTPTGEGQKRHKFTLTTGSGSGVLVPARVGPPITIKRQRNPFRAALLARGFRPIETTDSASLSVPIFDDSANDADVIAQDNTSENNQDPSLSALTLGADLYDSGTVWSSNKLLNSLSFDLLAYLEPMLDARIDRAQVAAWIVTLQAATIGKTTASTTGVTYAELLDWQHSIPVVRRANGVFFVSDGLLRAIRGLVDDNGQPLFQVSLRDDTPDTLLGWPIFAVDGLPTPAAGAVSGVAVDAEGLIIRDVTSRRIARYANIPTHPDQFGIRMFADGDMDFVPAAVRTLKHAAS